MYNVYGAYDLHISFDGIIGIGVIWGRGCLGVLSIQRILNTDTKYLCLK